jgi:hypothetical protein
MSFWRSGRELLEDDWEGAWSWDVEDLSDLRMVLERGRPVRARSLMDYSCSKKWEATGSRYSNTYTPYRRGEDSGFKSVGVVGRKRGPVGAFGSEEGLPDNSLEAICRRVELFSLCDVDEETGKVDEDSSGAEELRVLMREKDEALRVHRALTMGHAIYYSEEEKYLRGMRG